MNVTVVECTIMHSLLSVDSRLLWAKQHQRLHGGHVSSLSVRVQVLIIKTDGGPDRNTTFVGVQLAALALELDLCMLVLMRTAPGQSYVNPVERVMSVLNLAGQGLATARAACVPETEAALKGANSMKQVRQAFEKADAALPPGAETHTARYSAAMLEPISALEHAYGSMTWSGNPITIVPASTSAEHAVLLQHLTEIEPGFNYATDAKSDRLRHFPNLSALLAKHTRSGLYVWQYMRDAEIAPPLPLVPLEVPGSGALRLYQLYVDAACPPPVFSMHDPRPSGWTQSLSVP